MFDVGSMFVAVRHRCVTIARPIVYRARDVAPGVALKDRPELARGHRPGLDKDGQA